MPSSHLLDTLTYQSGVEYTATEILQQSALWLKVWESVQAHKNKLAGFLQAAFNEVDHIIFTGAGTSAFIGLSLHGLYFRKTGLLSQAVATTDIVSHPKDYFDKTHHPLIISFARSGNSPESLAALQLADKYTQRCHHLIICCDPDGVLASFQSDSPSFLFLLPEQANDKGLAMTSSYSSMLLTGILLVQLENMVAAREEIKRLVEGTDKLFSTEVQRLKTIASKGYERAVFLGSGPLLGTATEAQLKLQELTNGQVICKADSYLGFRHGPKAVLNGRILAVFFLSANAGVRRYELDLIRTIIKEFGHSPAEISGIRQELHVLVIAPNKKALEEMQLPCNGLNGNSVLSDAQCISALMPDSPNASDYWAVGAIVSAQVLALFASLNLGITPDTPSINGAISRVVQGVTIYPDSYDGDDLQVGHNKDPANPTGSGI